MRRTEQDLITGEHLVGQVPIDDPALPPRILSLFSGYGGLDLAVAAVLGGQVIAHAEIEPAACRVLEHRFPGVPNLGDVTGVDWTRLGPVDVICAGFPCQDVSLAGRRLGIRHDTRSGLWAQVAAAVDELRPPLVVIENVRGLLSARAQHPAHSDVEPCPWCMAGPDELSLRALGAVLGDLADLGYDAAWRLVPASAVGAPHERARVFAVAWPADADGDAVRVESVAVARGGGAPVAGRDRAPAADADVEGLERHRQLSPASREGEAAAHDRGAAADAGRDRLREPARTGTGRRAGGGEHARGETVRARDAGSAAENADVTARGERGLAAPGQAAGGAARADARRRGRAPAADTGRDDAWPGLTGEAREPAPAAQPRGSSDDAVPDPAGSRLERRAHGEVGQPVGGAAAAGGGPGARRAGDAADADGDRLEGLEGAPTGRDGVRADLGGDADRRRRDPAADPAGDGWGEGRAESAGELGRPHAAERGAVDAADQWGPYGPAVSRWEAVTRPAPPPTEPNVRGAERLSPRFVEWMMGLPDGWVVDVPGITRNEALKLLGNGVVPQQAAHAVAWLLGDVANMAAPPTSEDMGGAA